MKISGPVFIRKSEKRGYVITGSLPGYGTIRRYGRSEEEAKERFFEACNGAGSGAVLPRRRAEGPPTVDRVRMLRRPGE